MGLYSLTIWKCIESFEDFFHEKKKCEGKIWKLFYLDALEKTSQTNETRFEIDFEYSTFWYSHWQK